MADETSTTTLELQEYYAAQLIFQYVGLPKANATIQALVNPAIMPQTSIQEITFSLVPTSGTFVLSYDGDATAAINWNDLNATIQTKIQAITGLSSVTVAGEISTQSLVVTFTGVTPPALSLVVDSNTLLASATAVAITIAETDETLPLAVMNGFNLIEGTTIAVGAQLDIIGKYVGVSRSGFGFTTNITLDDSDYIQLIRMAIIKNSSGSSLATIQQFIYQLFNGEMLVYDYQDMTMSYVISQTIGTNDLVQMFITQGLLPQPMAVRITAIVNPPNVNLFSFRTYDHPAPPASSPFNSYADYQTDWPWLSYAMILSF